MRVAVVTDHTRDTRPGGATRLLETLLKTTPDGVMTDIVTPDHPHPEEAIASADVVFTYLLKAAPENTLQAILKHPAHVRWEIDWWPDEDGNAEWRQPIDEHARIVIFDSPLHHERFCSLYGIKLQRILVLPCPMDVKAIEQVRIPEDQRSGVVWFGTFHLLKGADLAIRWARDNRVEVDFYGEGIPSDDDIPYCNFLGFVEDDQWYSTLAAYSKMIHFPRVPDAFPYSVLEAYALGLEVEVTGQLGVESWNMSWDALLEWCAYSHEEFWDLLTGETF